VIMEDENVRVVQAKTLQKISDDVKALAKRTENPGATPAGTAVLMGAFLQNFTDLLSIQTDALMTNAVKNKINALTNTCLEKLTFLAKEGAHSEDSCEKLKDACIYFLRRKRETEACKIAEIFKYMAFNHKELRGFIIKLLGMIGCVAMKSKQTQLGLQCTDSIISTLHNLEPEDKEIETTALNNLQELASMAGRMRDEALFSAVISKIAVHYSTEKVVLQGQEMVDFLLALMFIAADRRYVNALPILRWMTMLLVHDPSMSKEQKLSFLTEWCVLAAQMASRNWEVITKTLLDGIFVFLTREKDSDLTRKVMVSLSAHFAMHCRWEGIERSFKMYKPWYNFLLVVFDKAVNDGTLPEPEKLRNMKFILRNQRDLLVTVARLRMEEEYTLFSKWMEMWMLETKNNPRRQKRARRFVQLTAQFWHMTQPRSSQKQWPLMKSIFEPSAISQRYWNLLTKIV
jgi:hypothetical protein